MKKINIGIILTILTIVIFTIYIIIDSNIKKKEMKEAFEFMYEYLELKEQILLFPEEYRDITKQIPEEEYNKYLEEVKTKLSGYVLNEQLDYIFNQYKIILDSEYKGALRYSKYKHSYVTPAEKNDLHESGNNINNIVKGNYVLNYSFVLETKGQKLIAPAVDKNTGKYVGTVKDYSNLRDFQISYIVLRKSENGTFKVVFDAVYP